ncbi:MAG: hypothetical protein JNL10_04250 [Verrucomicrobiales bacterium]|nr:hypothetical protein [Verrucomicrobiales bacterium]
MSSLLRPLGATVFCLASFLGPLSVPAAAQGPIQARFSLLDSHTTNGPANAVAWVGNFDAVNFPKFSPNSQSMEDWLSAVRVGDPVQLSLVAPVERAASVVTLRGFGPFLYGGDADGVFRIYSIDESQGWVRRSSLAYGGGGGFPQGNAINDFDVAGRFACVSVLQTVDVLDVSDPDHLSRKGSILIPVPYGRVTVSGQRAFTYGSLLAANPGYGVVDFQDPVSPKWVGNAGTDLGVFLSLRVSGNLACGVVGSVLKTLDVQDPTHPLVLGTCPSQVVGPEKADLAISGSLAYVGGPGGLEVFDISNPSQPVSLGRFDAVGGVAQVVAAGTTVHLAGDLGLSVVQVRTGLPQELHWNDTHGPVLALNIPYALAASASGGGDVQFRVESGPGSISGNELTVTGLGTVVVVASQAGDAVTLPVEERRAFNVPEVRVRLAGLLDTGGSAGAVTLVHERAYIADGTGGLVIADLSNPDAPVQLGHYSGGGAIFRTMVEGNTAYLMGELGLEVVDVGNAANPVRKGLLRDVPGTLPTALTGQGTRLAIGGYGGLGEAVIVMVDVSKANAPVQLGYDTFWWPKLSALDGTPNFLGWSDVNYRTFRLHDYRTPTQPQLAGNAHLRANATALRLTDQYAYVALGSTGLEVLDLDDFDSIRETATLGGLGETRDVDVAGDLAFLLSDTGIQVVEVGNPRSLRHVGARELPYAVSRVRASNGRLALAAGSRGLQAAEYRVHHPQALNWTLPSVIAFPGNPLLPGVSSSSGLSPVLSVVSGPARIDGDLIALTGVGKVVLRAVQAGNDTFLPVTSDWNLTVLPPALSVRANSGIDLTWASGVPGSKLQSSETLVSGGSWHDVEATVEESEGKSLVHLAASDRDLYFRLSAP